MSNKLLDFEERYYLALELLTKATPPRESVHNYIYDIWDDKEEHLQDWVGTTDTPWWCQNIGILDAAHAMASAPIEGHEHSDRISYEDIHDLRKEYEFQLRLKNELEELSTENLMKEIKRRMK